MTVRCVYVEPTGQQRVSLRRYTPDSDGRTCADGWHQAKVAVAVERYELEEQAGRRMVKARDDWDPDDPRWPTECAEGCGYRFTDDDRKQTFTETLYAGADGQPVALRDAPPGTMWDAWWMPSAWRKATVDGRYLIVVCPDGSQWAIDGQASNCTRPGEPHDCWCRHGAPPNLTVDKHPEPGRSTCAAGAGSIGTPGYHGFLRDGAFT